MEITPHLWISLILDCCRNTCTILRQWVVKLLQTQRTYSIDLCWINVHIWLIIDSTVIPLSKLWQIRGISMARFLRWIYHFIPCRKFPLWTSHLEGQQKAIAVPLVTSFRRAGSFFSKLYLQHVWSHAIGFHRILKNQSAMTIFQVVCLLIFFGLWSSHQVWRKIPKDHEGRSNSIVVFHARQGFHVPNTLLTLMALSKFKNIFSCVAAFDFHGLLKSRKHCLIICLIIGAILMLPLVRHHSLSEWTYEIASVWQTHRDLENAQGKGT